VGAEVLRLLKPLGVDAALNAIAARTAEGAEKRRQMELTLQQARYEVGHARRQYDVVDPDNRLVAGELERRWNETLMAVRQLEDQVEALQIQKQPALSDGEESGSCSWALTWSWRGLIRRRQPLRASGSSELFCTSSSCASRSSMSCWSCTGRAETTLN
jgi:hypothetical protein